MIVIAYMILGVWFIAAIMAIIAVCFRNNPFE